MTIRKYNIGLFGFGCVGKGFYDALSGSGYNQALIKKIIVKDRNKTRTLPKSYFDFEAATVFQDKSINLIVEAIDDAQEAFRIVKYALSKKIPVVSSSKKMIALHLDELIQLQEENNTPLLYEAAVCAAIPILRTLDTYYETEEIKTLSGIFNGTSNFIMTKIFDERKDYQQALKHAQEMGFAESNPASDVEGYDAAYKLCILIKHAWGVTFSQNELLTLGINHLSIAEINYAKQHNSIIKLVPRAFVIDNAVAAFVLPQFVKIDEALSQIKNENNIVTVGASYSGENSYSGKGAGALPTGQAVLSDVNSLINNYQYGYSKSKKPFSKIDTKELVIEIYLRYTDNELLKTLEIKSVSEGGYDDDNNYIIGYVLLPKLIENRNWINQSGSIVIATGRTTLQSDKSPLKQNYFESVNIN